MRILVLNYEYPPLGGGASPVSKEIAERLQKEGHHVEVVTMQHKSLKKEELINGVKIHRVPCLRSKVNICHPHEQLSYLVSARKFLKKYLLENNFDICHCHFLIPTGLLAMWVKKEFGIPYMVTIHGSDVPGFNPNRFQFLHVFTPPILKKVARNASQVISPSNYLKSLYEQKVKINNCVVIPNGIETFEMTSNSPKKNIILSTGRLLERKGFKTLVEAVSQLDFDFELHICGDGPMMQELKDSSKNSIMSIHFHGWMNNTSPEYQNLLASAKIYVLVSSHENASIAILEGMSRGCAVITSDTTGCLEMIDQVGLCIPPHDVNQLILALSQVMNDDNLRKEMGKKALEKSRKEYNWTTIVNSYANLSEEISRTI